MNPASLLAHNIHIANEIHRQAYLALLASCQPFAPFTLIDTHGNEAKARDNVTQAIRLCRGIADRPEHFFPPPG